MKRDGHEKAIFFIGPEVEHTPAYSKKTLFVVGKQDLNKIVELAREHKVPHVFMGANHSFDFDPADNTHYWDLTIQALLDRGFWVTLDYEAHQHKSVLKMLGPHTWQSRMFVPLLSVRIPNIQNSSVNLTVKMDDIDFKATNPGVWCMHFHEVTDSNRFTDWIEYGNDYVIDTEIVKEEPITPADMIVTTPSSRSKELIEELKKKVSPVKNDENLGLDPDSKSMLKGEPERIMEKLNITALDAAEAYAEGAKTDPLGKETLTLKKKK